ncbi:MAG TPA: hypothetical protein PKV83_04165, partial [Methanothrix sp.]|nr:hypothetical protein [Methanothrix sp.]
MIGSSSMRLQHPIFFVVLISLILAHTSSAASSPVLAVQINDAITPASDDIVAAAVQEAEAGDYQALI